MKTIQQADAGQHKPNIRSNNSDGAERGEAVLSWPENVLSHFTCGALVDLLRGRSAGLSLDAANVCLDLTTFVDLHPT
jgi:hypothetical protein